MYDLIINGLAIIAGLITSAFILLSIDIKRIERKIDKMRNNNEQ